MDFGGRYLFAAPRERVWAALNDAALLKIRHSGMRDLEWTGPTTLDLKLKVHLGLIHPTFSGDLTLSDIRPVNATHCPARAGVLPRLPMLPQTLPSWTLPAVQSLPSMRRATPMAR